MFTHIYMHIPHDLDRSLLDNYARGACTIVAASAKLHSQLIRLANGLAEIMTPVFLSTSCGCPVQLDGYQN